MARAALWLPWFITSRMLHSIQIAEEKAGRPVIFAEVMAVMNNVYPSIPVKGLNEALAICTSMIREDWVYMDSHGYRMSLTRHEGFKNFSEWFKHHFGNDYKVDKSGALICTNKNEVVNLEQRLNFLKSKDQALWDS